MAAHAAGQAVLIQGPGPMFHMGFTDAPDVRDYRETFATIKRYAAFTLALQERGIRIIGRGLWYISAAHSEAEIDHSIAVASEVLRAV